MLSDEELVSKYTAAMDSVIGWSVAGLRAVAEAAVQAEREGAVAERRHCRPCNSQRKGDSCWKCGTSTDPVDSEWEYPALPDVEPIRKLAHEAGYALAIHGSLERDLDLIAAPWTDEAISAKELILHIVRGLSAIVVGPIEQKPLGRIAASIKIQGWFKMIDLSVCPPQASATVPEGYALVPLDKLALAYGMLWHVNADLDAPALVKRPSVTPAQGAHKARHVLRDMLTHAQRGDGINAALDALAASQPVAAQVQTAQHSSPKQAHVTGSRNMARAVRVCPTRDVECGEITRHWCSTCPNKGFDKAQGVVS